MSLHLLVASRVLDQENLQLDGALLTVTRHVKTPVCCPGSPDDVISTLNTIEVNNIDPCLPLDYVELFFENLPKSGGGPIDHINLEGGRATITYKEPKGVSQYDQPWTLTHSITCVSLVQVFLL